MNQKTIGNDKSLPHVATVLVLSVLITNGVYAASPQAVPNAGTLLQQVQPPTPAAPSSNDTGLSIEQEGGAKLPPSAPFMVNAIQISGNTLFDASTLHALVVDAEGKNLSLTQLGEFVDRITDFYHHHKYPLTRAIIPPQTIQAGVVHIEVIEARYDKITLDNHSGASDSLLQHTLSSLQGGQPIEENALDHALLLVSDIPGVVATTILKPGATAATSDLVVETTATAAMVGTIVVDDYGNRYTGRERINATLNFVNLLHQGDVLSMNALSSGSGMNNGRFAYDALLNGEGTRVGASYSALHYNLGDTLTALGGHGTANVSDWWLKHPLLRSRDVNFYAQLEYEHQQLNDEIDVSATHTDRHLDNWIANLSGDLRDTLQGVNTWSIGVTSGHLSFDNANAQAADAATSKTQDAFTKWTANYTRLQSLGQNSSLSLAFSGQWASTNLDSSEKLAAGGAYTVRAYDMSAVSGDTGSLANVEYRYGLGQLWYGQSQAVFFVDSAHVAINQTVWASGVNSVTLSGMGIGLNWLGADQWSAKAYVATPIGPMPELIGTNKSARGWIEIDKGF